MKKGNFCCHYLLFEHYFTSFLVLSSIRSLLLFSSCLFGDADSSRAPLAKGKVASRSGQMFSLGGTGAFFPAKQVKRMAIKRNKLLAFPDAFDDCAVRMQSPVPAAAATAPRENNWKNRFHFDLNAIRTILNDERESGRAKRNFLGSCNLLSLLLAIQKL